MREVRLKYASEVLKGTPVGANLALFHHLELMNTLGRATDDQEVTLLVKVRLAQGVEVEDLNGLPTVTVHEVVRKSDGEHGEEIFLIVSLRHPLIAIPLQLPDAGITGLRLGAGGGEVVIRGTASGCSALVAAFRAWNDRCTVAVGMGSDETGDGNSGLTEQQLIAARLSIEMGYHDVPRRCTLAEVAARAGVSSATMSGHLREVNRVAHLHLLDLMPDEGKP